jgi:putative hemolysin
MKLKRENKGLTIVLLIFIVIAIIVVAISVWYFFIPHECGGLMGIKCPIGYKCYISSNIADAMGTCVHNMPAQGSDKIISCCNQKFTCAPGVPACMPNPASVYCNCIGGTLGVIEEPAGQRGICKFAGITYDEWELFSKNCPNNPYV